MLKNIEEKIVNDIEDTCEIFEKIDLEIKNIYNTPYLPDNDINSAEE